MGALIRVAALLALWLVCCVGAMLALVVMLLMIAVNQLKARAIAAAIDRAVNITANGRNETVSSRANRGRREGARWACVLCRWLDWIEKDHCAISAEDDKSMKKPPETT